MRLLKVIDRWLPPPKALRLSGLGVDISETSAKYVGFAPSRTGWHALTLETHGEVDIGPDILSQGEVKDVGKLAGVLARVKKETGQTHVRLSLPEERVYVFETEIEAGLETKEARSQIEFRLEENVPLSPRDAYFDFEITSSTRGSGRALASVTVCAKALVDSYYEACRQAKLVPLSFEVESQAIARSVLPQGHKGTHLLLDFGKTRTGLGIVTAGSLLYTSTIDLGGKDLSSALIRQLGEQPESELTRIKNDIGLAGSGDSRGATEAMLPVISVIKDEVQTRLRYWHEKNGGDRPVESIVLCGGSANLRGLTAYLTETLGVETMMADVWQNAFDSRLVVPAIDRRHSYGFSTAIGLALASFT